jgi:hypothetical protein
MCARRAFEDCMYPASHNTPPGGALSFSALRYSAMADNLAVFRAI